MQPIPARLRFRVTDVTSGWYPHGLSVGPDLDPIVHLIDRPPRTNGFSDEPPARFRALHFAPGGMRTLTLPPMQPVINHVQPLADGNWLMVGWFEWLNRFHSRSEPTDNARIYQPDGTIAASFYLGHSINHVQSAGDGTLWVGYSDEGVFSGESTSANGLAQLDVTGNLLFGFNRHLDKLPDQEEAQRYSMTDCAALNVVSPDEIWLCYWAYDHLDPVVRLGARRIEASWFDNPLVLPHVMAVDGQRVLFGNQRDFPESLLLMTLDTMEILELQPVDADGRPILRTRLWRNFEDQEPFSVADYHLAARGSRLYILTASGDLHFLDLQDIPAIPNRAGVDPHSYVALSSRIETAQSGLALQSVIGTIVRDFGGTEQGRGLLVRAMERQAELADEAREIIVSWILRALNQHWSDDEYRSLLFEWSNSEDDLVRRMALTELGDRFPQDDAVRKIAVWHALHDSDSSARSRAKGILSRGWPSDPKTFEIVSVQAQTDPSDDVRQSAIMALGRMSDNPRSRDILLDLLRSDSDDQVRWAAAIQLQSYWAEDESILDLLLDLAVTAAAPGTRADIIRALRARADLVTFFRERVLAEPAGAPRRAALIALATHASDDPLVFSMVHESLKEGSDYIDRADALRLLRRLWPDHPETLSLLWDRAVSDSDRDIRNQALQAIHDGYALDIDRLVELADILRLGPDESAQQEAARLIMGAIRRPQ